MNKIDLVGRTAVVTGEFEESGWPLQKDYLQVAQMSAYGIATSLPLT